MQQTANDVDQVKVATQQTAADVDQMNAVVQETATDVDQVKRLSSPNLITLIMEPYPFFQDLSYGITFVNGSPRQTHRRTTISHVVLITRKQRPGFFKAASFKSGSRRLRFSGSTENVCTVLFPTRPLLIVSCIVAGSGKSVIWFVDY